MKNLLLIGFLFFSSMATAQIDASLEELHKFEIDSGYQTEYSDAGTILAQGFDFRTLEPSGTLSNFSFRIYKDRKGRIFSVEILNNKSNQPILKFELCYFKSHFVVFKGMTLAENKGDTVFTYNWIHQRIFLNLTSHQLISFDRRYNAITLLNGQLQPLANISCENEKIYNLSKITFSEGGVEVHNYRPKNLQIEISETTTLNQVYHLFDTMDGFVFKDVSKIQKRVRPFDLEWNVTLGIPGKRPEGAGPGLN